MKLRNANFTALGAVLLVVGANPCLGQLAVVSVEPAARSLVAPVDGSIVVHFDRPVEPTSFVERQTFWAFGRWSGPSGFWAR